MNNRCTHTQGDLFLQIACIRADIDRRTIKQKPFTLQLTKNIPPLTVPVYLPVSSQQHYQQPPPAVSKQVLVARK
jgi:hypothetical protein